MTPPDLTTQQAAAFSELLSFAQGKTDHAMAVLRGFAGTGKTYLVARLIQALNEKGLFVAVAAPTNKAVRVLREKIVAAGVAMPEEPTDESRKNWGTQAMGNWIEFGSIHSLLGLQLAEREDGTQECRSARDPCLHEYDLAIVDESSMIGSDLFNRIVAAKRRCRVLFVGDPAQLPPIEPGEAVSPTFSRVTCELVLSDVVRQARDNPIIRLSMLLRQAIETGQRIDATAIASALPPLNESPAAALVPGGAETVASFALHEIRAGRDARIVAFTNAAVLNYNHMIHESLHGITEFPFVTGEPVIVHAQCDAYVCGEDGKPNGLKTTLITSEEAVVRSVAPRQHPYWDDIPASSLVLDRDNGSCVLVYAAQNPVEVERAVGERFAEWRRIKAETDEAYRRGDSRLGRVCQDRAKAASAAAWKLRKAFAPLRHAYALTAHKSQGSTFDTAIVDLSDMAKMRSAFQFNRGLYVAATRPRSYLAIVV